MKRFQDDKPVMLRQSKLVGKDDLGRFRKRHALDCGHARCGVCHSDKYPNRQKHEHEILSDISFREQLEAL